MIEFTKRPGELATADLGDGFAVLLGDPDWVDLPADLGGGRARIVRTWSAPCPITGALAKHYELEGGLYVAESDRFYWYRRRGGSTQ